jgi:hypothetical protein
VPGTDSEISKAITTRYLKATKKKKISGIKEKKHDKLHKKREVVIQKARTEKKTHFWLEMGKRRRGS